MRGKRTAWLVVALASMGCDDGGGGEGGGGAGGAAPPVGSGEARRVTVGAEGGEIAHEGVTLSIPAGALAADTEITITSTTADRQGPFTRYSPVYRFEPNGLAFAAPVSVRIAFEGEPEAPAVYWTGATGGFERLDSVVDGGVATAQVTHFSEGFVGSPVAGAEPDAGAGDCLGDAPAPSSDPLAIARIRVIGGETTRWAKVDRLARAADGDVLAHITFEGELDLGSGPLTDSGTVLARFSPEGELRWSSEGPLDAQRLEVAPSGELLLAGSKIEVRAPDGTPRWTATFHRDDSTGSARAIAADADGNVHAVGVFDGEVDFGGEKFRSAKGTAAFYVVYDRAGNHRFSAAYGDEHATANTHVVVHPEGGVVIAGEYTGDVLDFGGGPLPQPGAVGHDSRIHVVRLGPDGDHRWSRGFGAPGQQLRPLLLALAPCGDPVLVANFYNGATIDLGRGPVTAEPALGLFIARLSRRDGSVVAVRVHEGIHATDSSRIEGDIIYLAGGASEPVDLGDGPFGPDPDPPNGVLLPSAFLAVLGIDGTPRASIHFDARRTMRPDVPFDLLHSMSVVGDGRGGLFWAGDYIGEVEVGGQVLPLTTRQRGFLAWLPR